MKNNRTYSSDVIGPKMLELLGIPAENCVRATIKIEHDLDIVVEAEFYASMEVNQETGGFDTLIKHYSLVEDQ